MATKQNPEDKQFATRALTRYLVKMTTKYQNYEISDDKTRLQLETVHHLLKDAYWCKGIPQKTVARAIENSLCFGVYLEQRQVGFARVVTDNATFAWLCDVVIDDQFKKLGLGKALMEFIMAHPDLKSLRRICLATKDAHELYKKYGFKVTETPQNWMEIKNNNIYLSATSPGEHPAQGSTSPNF